jgi:hypothetical protein
MESPKVSLYLGEAKLAPVQFLSFWVARGAAHRGDRLSGECLRVAMAGDEVILFAPIQCNDEASTLPVDIGAACRGSVSVSSCSNEQAPTLVPEAHFFVTVLGVVPRLKSDRRSAVVSVLACGIGRQFQRATG